MGKSLSFTRPDGKTTSGYLAEPSADGAPGVVMFEEWWGLNDEIKADAEKLASGGFRVLVPDLFGGRVATTRDEATHLVSGLDFTDAATQDGRGAALYLQHSGSAKVGVTGFCIGGALAMLCAMHVSEFDAVVTFYGYPPPEAGDPGLIKIPVMGHWALQDQFYNPPGVEALETRLKEGGVPYEFYRYDANHGFCNPKGLGHYSPENAEIAWKHTIGFFRRALT
jgi:carboxymethylenebutenolidase